MIKLVLAVLLAQIVALQGLSGHPPVKDDSILSWRVSNAETRIAVSKLNNEYYFASQHGFNALPPFFIRQVRRNYAGLRMAWWDISAFCRFAQVDQTRNGLARSAPSKGGRNSNIESGRTAEVFQHYGQSLRISLYDLWADIINIEVWAKLELNIFSRDFVCLHHSLGGLASIFDSFQGRIESAFHEPDTKGSNHQSAKREEGHSSSPKLHPLLGLQIFLGAGFALAGLYLFVDALNRSRTLDFTAGTYRIGLGGFFIGGGILLATLAFYPG